MERYSRSERFSFLFAPHLEVLRVDPRLCAQESCLAVLRGPYGLPGMQPRLAACKANGLPAVLSLWSKSSDSRYEFLVSLVLTTRCPRVGYFILFCFLVWGHT